MSEIKAPNPLIQDDTKKIFLGGSIEMGKAEKWQDKLIQLFSRVSGVTFWNPRRDDWDASWVQDPTPGTQFHEQVSWELNAQEEADAIVYYFAPDTMSPITLLELGVYSNSGKVIVCCPDGYERKGNVIITCKHIGVPVVETFEELVDYISEFVV